jgi:sugar (pentulose or hexulose) kinase
VWVQIVADVVERQLELPDVVDGACRGAALLAIKALGLGDAIDLAAATPISRVVTPERMAADTYREIRPRFVALRDLLVR